MSINLGLKRYQTETTQEIGSLKAHVNIGPNTSNLVVEIPLFETFGSKRMAPVLIYNFQKRNNSSLFMGAELNYFYRLSKSGNTYYVTNPDMTVDSYINGITNKETNAKLSIDYVGYYRYRLKDKKENIIEFDSYDNSLIKSITYKDSRVLTLTKSGLVPTNLSLGSGEEILFTYYGTYIGKISYRRYGTIKYNVYISLTNNKISKVEIKKVNNNTEYLINEYQIIENNNKIIVKDNIIGYYYTYEYDNNDRITKYYDSRYVNNTIKYLNREKTKLVSAAKKAIYKGIPYSLVMTIIEYLLGV